jgi:hypothetical protein
LPPGPRCRPGPRSPPRLCTWSGSGSPGPTERPVPPGQVLVRTVGAGEIVPLAAIAPADQILSRPVTIPMDGEPPAGLAPGGLVDLWASTRLRDAVGGGYDEPERIARTVEVFDVRAPGTSLSASRTGSVQVLLPSEALAPVLDALANQARLVVLPVPGTATGAGVAP